MQEKQLKESKQVEILARLIEEVTKDQELYEIEEENIDEDVLSQHSRSTNSMWNKSQFTRVLSRTGFGSKQQLKIMLKEKRYTEVLERCLKAMLEIQNTEAQEHEYQASTFHEYQSPERRLNTSYFRHTLTPKHNECRNSLNAS